MLRGPLRANTNVLLYLTPTAMPLEYQCVRCVQCEAIMAKQATKSDKWSCKLCGAKQTLTRVFAVSGSAKDIRQHVQQLNMARANQQAAKDVRRCSCCAWSRRPCATPATRNLGRHAWLRRT